MVSCSVVILLFSYENIYNTYNTITFYLGKISFEEFFL